MNIINFFLIIFLLNSCSSSYIQDDFVSQYNKFGEYHAQYTNPDEDRTKEENLRMQLLTIRFDTDNILEDQTMAQCAYNDLTIVVSKTYWEQFDDDLKEIVIFHEMGHCVLLLKGHKSGTIMDIRAKNILYRYKKDKISFLESFFKEEIDGDEI